MNYCETCQQGSNENKDYLETIKSILSEQLAVVTVNQVSS